MFYIIRLDEPIEICEEKEYIRDSIDRGKVIVVVSPTETKPLASSEHLKNKINNNMSFLDIISPMHSLEEKNFDNDDDDDDNDNDNDDDDDDDNDDDDNKENVKIKRISSESIQSCGSREVDKIFPQQQHRTQGNRSPRRKSTSIPTLLCIDNNKLVDATSATGVKRKIPRPANAFMLFANEWRRKLAAENPRESNKDITILFCSIFCRLGVFWKNMSKDIKEKYFALAREVDKEHKRKYPGMYCIVLFNVTSFIRASGLNIIS
ncbi:SRY protein, partial [Acromyrmex heyeri]